MELRAHVQLEERICDLKHEYMRMTVVVHNENSFYRPPHAEVLIVVL